MPPGADLDEAKAVEIIERGQCVPLQMKHFSQLSMDCTADDSHHVCSTGNTSTRQSEYVDLEYDPISLKEPQDLHSWDWLGCPSRFLRFLLHKSVQEVSRGRASRTSLWVVRLWKGGYPFPCPFPWRALLQVDGRDQHCALMFWMLILVGFIAYGAFLFAGPIQQRKNPPQSFEFLSDPEELGPISHLPYMVRVLRGTLHSAHIETSVLISTHVSWRSTCAVPLCCHVCTDNLPAAELDGDPAGLRGHHAADGVEPRLGGG